MDILLRGRPRTHTTEVRPRCDQVFRHHAESGFVLEDEPDSTGRPDPSAQSHTSLTHPATYNSCGVNRRKKVSPTRWPRKLRSIRAARTGGAPIYVILGNLSAHKGADIRRWAKKNTIDTIANSNHPIHTMQTRALHAHLRWRTL